MKLLHCKFYNSVFYFFSQVKLNELQEYLVAMREAGYSIVGLEQTMKSKSLSAYKFKHKTVVVLG